MMYYFVYALLYLLSLLPLWFLYGITDLVFLLVYYGFGYRKKVVLQNLLIAFPEKTAEERKQIAKKFYRNFTDFFAETIKLFSANKAFLQKRFRGNYDVLNQLYAQGKKSQVHLGHNFNWELAWQSAASSMQAKALGVYMPLSNKTFDRIFHKFRGRWGGHLLPANDMRNALLPFRQNPYTLILVADQSPGNLAKGYWINFFNRPTAFYSGPERGARTANLPVVFCYIHKLKRGFYEVHFEPAIENPAALPEGELTRIYVRYLEKKMRLQPDNWLWTHRRWKHEWKEAYGPVMD